MALTRDTTGTPEAADIRRMMIKRCSGGDLRAKVYFSIEDADGGTFEEQAEWVLTAGEKAAIQELVPSALAAIAASIN